jgi:Uncharacterized proteins of the AP superfamily
MKKVLIILFATLLSFLFVFPLVSCEKNEEQPFRYERVVIIGVDGMGAFNSETPTPRMDGIFAGGATTYTMQSTTPSVSGPSWGSMFYGVDPEAHGWTNENMTASAVFSYSSFLAGYSDVDSPKNPNKREPEGIYSLFKFVSDAYPGAALAAICNWMPIWAYVEHGVKAYLKTGINLTDELDDSVIKDEVLNYFDAGNDPKFLYVHFDNVDYKGHHMGSATADYLDQITAEDGYIGEIYDKLCSLGLLGTTLFIVTPDHGHKPEGGHGGATPAEMNCFVGIAGKTVKAGTIGPMDMKDMPFIVARALNIGPASFWSGKLPDNIF